MAKAVLISIRPEWVEKILSGEKTLEVRKTRPKLETPFKAYIYCTAGNLSYKVNNGMLCNLSGGRLVVGEFVCDKITWLTHVGFSGLPGIWFAAMKDSYTIDDSFGFSESCLTTPQIEKYLGGNDGYAWHISKLEIYDTPKPLSEFSPPFENCIGKVCDEFGCASCENGGHIKRPPQSWCYVEGVE
nr:MAG TPA: hypothetical protein [Caudoviricetes sp.]